MTDTITLPRSVVEQALDALDCIYSPLHVREINKIGAAMATLRAALEQPVKQEPVEQAPVAWVETDEDGEIVWNTDSCFSDDPDWLDNPTALYFHPQPKREPLTDEQIKAIWRGSSHMDVIEVVREIERAHGIGGEK